MPVSLRPRVKICQYSAESTLFMLLLKRATTELQVGIKRSYGMVNISGAIHTTRIVGFVALLAIFADNFSPPEHIGSDIKGYRQVSNHAGVWGEDSSSSTPVSSEGSGWISSAAGVLSSSTGANGLFCRNLFPKNQKYMGMGMRITAKQPRSVPAH